MRFLFVDRILELSPGEVTRGIKHVTGDDYYLTRADDGRLCFTPSLIGETLGQLAAWNVMHCNNFTKRPVAGIVSSAHVIRPVYPGETLLLESIIDSLDESSVRYHSVASVGNEEVFRIDSALGPMLPMQDFIDDATIRRQFAEINRPGDVSAYQSMTKIESVLSNAGPSGFMSFDQVVDFQPGQRMSALKKVNLAAPYFPDHFPRKPVLPMTVLLECKLNLARDFVKQSKFEQNYQAREMRRIKMNEFVLPGDVLASHLTVKDHDSDELVLSFRSEVDNKRVCVLDVVMTAKEQV